MTKPTHLRTVEPDRKLDEYEQHAINRLRDVIARIQAGTVTGLVGIVVTENEDGDEGFERIDVGLVVNEAGVAAGLRILARENEDAYEAALVDPDAGDDEPNE